MQGQPNSYISLAPYSNTSQAQWWIANPVAGQPHYFYLRWYGTSGCLTSYGVGAYVKLSPCANTPAQVWHMPTIG